MSYKYPDISIFNGKTITNIYQHKFEEIKIFTSDGDFVIKHHQNCCEHVRIFDVYGKYSDFIGKKITSTNSEISEEWPDDVSGNANNDSFTWTTQTFVSDDGDVLKIRWLGESNGYYGEGVSIDRI